MSEHEVLAIASAGVIVASVAVIITFVGILLSNRRTKESNTMTRTELKHRFRAWIKIENLFGYLITVDGVNYSWNEYWGDTSKHPGKISSRTLKTEIRNIGEMPAIDLSGNFLQDDKPITREMLGKFDSSTLPFPLVPGDIFPKTFDVTEEVYANSNKKPLYFGILVRYQVNNVEKGIGKIWKYDGTITTEDTWLEE